MLFDAVCITVGADYGADRRADFPPKMRVFALALEEEEEAEEEEEEEWGRGRGR